MPHERIAPLLREHFVALAAGGGRTEHAVMALTRKIPDANVLPFVVFTDAEGHFLEGTSGPQTPREFLDRLERLRDGRPDAP